MATVTDCIRDLSSPDLKKFLVQMAILTDDVAQQLIHKFATGPIWANDITVPDCKNDEALFRLYALEDIGIVSSKIEHKGGIRYERRFYLTDLGKKLLNH